MELYVHLFHGSRQDLFCFTCMKNHLYTYCVFFFSFSFYALKLVQSLLYVS